MREVVHELPPPHYRFVGYHYSLKLDYERKSRLPFIVVLVLFVTVLTTCSSQKYNIVMKNRIIAINT